MDIKGIKILYAWFLLIKLPSVNGLDVNPVNPKKFDTVVITANASGLSTVIWEKDTITLTSCYVSIDTCSSPNKIAGATIAVNKGVAESTITIPSANQTFHGGLYDATGSNPVEVIINTLPVNINWTVQPQGNLTTGSSATWTAKIYCVFPTPEINVDFTVHIEGVKEVSPRSPTLSKEADPNCDFPEETVVAMLSLSSSDIQTFLNKKVYIIANASHGSFPTEPSVTSGQSAEAIFQGEVSKESKAIEERSEKVLKRTAQIDPVGSAGHGSGSGTIQKLGKLTFTNPVAKRWHFSNQYTFFGTVVYGIQIVLVSAVSDIVTIAIVVGVLVYYCGQIKCITILYLFLLTAAFSIVGVLIYILILAFFGDKDLIHIKFKKKKDSIKLSAHGMKPIKDNICIYFKVKAIYASITLHIIENMEEHHDGSKPKIRQLKKVLTLCFIDNMNDSNDSNHGNAIQYQDFYLKYENKTKTITVFDGNYKQIEQWTISADSFKIGDIEISNIKPDDSTKDDSANYDSTKDDSKIDNSSKDNSTEIEQAELYTSEEWKFWFREGDTLSENSQFHQTVLLFCVVILPIAWLVMIVLVLRNLLKSEEKNTDNTESELKVNPNQNQKEPSEQQIKKQNDAKGKWFDFIWFSCFHNSVKPNSTTDDNKPKAMMPGSYLANSPKGRNLPKLPEIVTQGDEIRKTKRKDKKKKKIKNQDSKMNDKQQSHSDKQDITFQPEIAVPAYTLETE